MKSREELAEEYASKTQRKMIGEHMNGHWVERKNHYLTGYDAALDSIKLTDEEAKFIADEIRNEYPHELSTNIGHAAHSCNHIIKLMKIVDRITGTNREGE